MTDLRKAAEMALEALESVYGKGKRCEAALEALRQALAQDALKTVADIDHSIGLFVDSPKEWVGLTDEEIYDYADKFLYQHGSNYGIRSFGKAIEAKLKEKNNGSSNT